MPCVFRFFSYIRVTKERPFASPKRGRTVSSAGLERCLDRAEVAGSNPAQFTELRLPIRYWHLYLVSCSSHELLLK